MPDGAVPALHPPPPGPAGPASAGGRAGAPLAPLSPRAVCGAERGAVVPVAPDGGTSLARVEGGRGGLVTGGGARLLVAGHAGGGRAVVPVLERSKKKTLGLREETM